jgi:monofunctional glycosyltransferase
MKQAFSALATGAGLMLLIFVLIFSFMYFSADVSLLNTHYPSVYMVEEQADYQLQSKPPKDWVKLNQISPYARWAVILSEDWSFYQHQGVDFQQLQNAIEASVKEKRLVRGASTISQQVVKNLYLSSRRSVIRKLHEIVLTRKMEQQVPKEKILEAYFNIIELGPKIYGIHQGSFHYFKKHPSKLNPREAAFLAMLLPSPKKYSESFRKKKLSPFVRNRLRDILLKMKMAKIITEEEREEWLDARFEWELD